MKLEGPAMDRRLPARPCRLLWTTVLGAPALCPVAWAMDPESQIVQLAGAPASASSGGWVAPVVACAFAGAVVLFLALSRARRLRARPGSGIEVIDRTAMGRGRALSLVRVGDRVVLVGESTQGFQRLAEFSAEEAPAANLRRMAS